jgi:hypothetical protein
MWPEDVENIPITGLMNDPFRMLLAGKDYYYIYNPEHDFMYRAGQTLEEVYEGLKEDKDGRGEIEWEVMETTPSWEWRPDFPCWDEREGRCVLRDGLRLEPFAPLPKTFKHEHTQSN